QRKEITGEKPLLRGAPPFGIPGMDQARRKENEGDDLDERGIVHGDCRPLTTRTTPQTNMGRNATNTLLWAPLKTFSASSATRTRIRVTSANSSGGGFMAGMRLIAKIIT